ncbi:MAG: nickel pincer cofactor biosynthesis protein LarC [Chitinispirillaceae bacterium]
MKTVYFQLICGASGDMILSSLIDLGVPLSYLREAFNKLPIEGVKIDTRKTVRSGITCAQLQLEWSDQKRYRHLPDILEVIGGGGYSSVVVENCEKILLRIARAEAKVHGIPVEKVHFHEIGAVDTIIDVLGACLAFEYLGVAEIVFSPLTVGQGMVNCAHGKMPVPVPATVEMIQGYATVTLDVQTEILTPTGCAILTALGTQSNSCPAGKSAKVGYGTGEKDFGSLPNILRAQIVETEEVGLERGAESDSVTVIESDMDHISGELMGYAAEQLMSHGALDVSWLPICMKKGRPGYRLTIICNDTDRQKLIDCAFKQTRTLGVRYHACTRAVLPRHKTLQRLHGNEVTAKHFTIGNRRFTKAEYESLAQIARKSGIPLIDLYEDFLRKG